MVGIEKRRKHDLSFHEDEIKLANRMMDKGRTTLEFLYYLMEHTDRLSFTIILISAENMQMENFLKQSKRTTDVLIEIDKKRNLYMLLCQSTDLDGGEQFGKILISNIRTQGGNNSYCVETEVMSISYYTIQEVIFSMVEKYLYIKRLQESDKVFFASVGKIKFKEY